MSRIRQTPNDKMEDSKKITTFSFFLLNLKDKKEGINHYVLEFWNTVLNPWNAKPGMELKTEAFTIKEVCCNWHST